MNQKLQHHSTALPHLKEAWDNYWVALEEIRLALEATPRFQGDPQNRAKAYHCLMELQAMAYNHIIAPRKANPRILKNCGWQTDIYALGQNCPDFIYGVFFVDGRLSYKIKGRMGDSPMFLLQTHNGVEGEQDFKTTGDYNIADYAHGKERSFELILSATSQAGNWIKIEADVDYQYVLIRRAISDWLSDPGELSIELIDEPASELIDVEEFDEGLLASRIRRATAFIHCLGLKWTIGFYDIYLAKAGGRKNVLSVIQGGAGGPAGSPSSNYAFGLFELAEDDVLLIEMSQAPDGNYWSFQLGDVWSRSLPPALHQTSLNNLQTAIDGDGGVHVVVSSQDPGVANWLDTCGRHEGTIVFRNFQAKSAPKPSVKKLKLHQLKNYMPKDTKYLTQHERAAIIEKRRLGQLNLYDE